jgi:protein TonB
MKLPRHVQRQQSADPARASSVGGFLRSLTASLAVHLFVVFAVSLPAPSAGLAPGTAARARAVAFSGGGHPSARRVLFSEAAERSAAVTDTFVEPQEFEALELAAVEPPEDFFEEDPLSPALQQEEDFARLLSKARFVEPVAVEVEEFSMLVATLEREVEPRREDEAAEIEPGDVEPGESTESEPNAEDEVAAAEGSEERPARIASGFPPAYPGVALRMGWEGAVLCELEIDAAGRVLSVSVLESSGYEVLDQAAVEALEKWRFEPGTRAGLAVTSRLEHRIRFQLNG